MSAFDSLALLVFRRIHAENLNGVVALHIQQPEVRENCVVVVEPHRLCEATSGLNQLLLQNSFVA